MVATDNFTKERADIASKCIDEIFKAVPKSKQAELLGELNDLSLFVSAARRHAPSENETPSNEPTTTDQNSSAKF